MSDGIALEIVAAAPSSIVAGDSHLFTIDVKHDGTRWPYAREEHILHCIAGASPGLSVEALGPESMVLHRFGGTYGGITYKLTADGTQPDGRLIIKLLNSAGITLGTARLPIAVEDEGEVRIAAVPPTVRASNFSYNGRAAAFVIGVGRYAELPPDTHPHAVRSAQAFAAWATECGGVDPDDLFATWSDGEPMSWWISGTATTLVERGPFDRLWVYFAGAGQYHDGDVMLLPADARAARADAAIWLGALQQRLARVAPDQFYFLDIDDRFLGGRAPNRPASGVRPHMHCALAHEGGASDVTRDYGQLVLEALAGHGERGTVTWADLVRYVERRLPASIRAFGSGNPVLVTEQSSDGSAEPPLEFTGHYLHLITDAEESPSGKDEQARMLGRELAQSGIGLVLDSNSRLDLICVEAYLDVLGGRADARIVSFVEILPATATWTHILAATPEHRYRACTLAAMAVIQLGESAQAAAALEVAHSLGRTVLALPDPTVLDAAAVSLGILEIADELEEMVARHQWPRPALARCLAWRELSSYLSRRGLLRTVFQLDHDDDGTPILDVLQASGPLGDRDSIPTEVGEWARARDDVPDLALAMELLVELRHTRTFTELTSARDPDLLTDAAELAELYILGDEARGFLYSWRHAPSTAPSSSPPLFVDDLPVIGRHQLWGQLSSMVSGDTHTMLITGEKQAGKSFTVRLIRELTRSLGSLHRMVSLRLTDDRLSSFVAQLEPYLGPDRLEGTDPNIYVRIQRRLRQFIAASPGVVTWLAIDCAGQRTDAELSYLFPGLFALAALPDVRLILIDSDVTAGKEDQALEVHLTLPTRDEVRAFLSAAYPQLDRATADEIIATTDRGWTPLLDRIEELDEVYADAVSDMRHAEQEAQDLRRRLERLADEYNIAAEAQQSPSTAALDAIVKRAREDTFSPASVDDLRQLYDDLESRPGGRVVALACSVHFQDAAPFDLIARSLRHADHAHERDTALDVLSELLDSASWWQADEAVAAALHVDRMVARRIFEQYRRNCGLPDTVTPEMLADWWFPAGSPWSGLPRRMAVFGSTQPEPDELRQYWLRRLADDLGVALATAGWAVVAGNGAGIGPNAVASAVHAGGDGTLLIGRTTEAADSKDLPPYAEIVDMTFNALMERAQCAIAIAGGEGTDEECRGAQRMGIPVLLTDTRAKWPLTLQAVWRLRDRNIPRDLIGALDAPPDSTEDYARRIVRVAGCLRLAGLKRRFAANERSAWVEFLDGLSEEELDTVIERVAGDDFARSARRDEPGRFIDHCEQREITERLLSVTIPMFGGRPDFEDLTTALGYRTLT